MSFSYLFWFSLNLEWSWMGQVRTYGRSFIKFLKSTGCIFIRFGFSIIKLGRKVSSNYFSHRFNKITDGTLDVVFSRFMFFSITITLRRCRTRSSSLESQERERACSTPTTRYIFVLLPQGYSERKNIILKRRHLVSCLLFELIYDFSFKFSARIEFFWTRVYRRQKYWVQKT